MVFQIRAEGFDPTGGGNPGESVIFEHNGPKASGFHQFTYAFGSTELGLAPFLSLQAQGTQNANPIRLLLGASDNAFPDFGSANPPIPLSPAPYEVSVFAFDPELRLEELATVLDDSTWRSLTRTNRLAGLNDAVTMPDAVVLPATLDPFGPTPTLTRLSPASFLRGVSSQKFGGAPSAPLGFGSVKAARLQQEGLCSKFTPYSEFYQGIDANLRDSLLRANGAACFEVGTTAKVGYDNFAAFLAHEAGAPTNARGGFLFNVDATIRTAAYPLTFLSTAQQTCHLTATAGFEPYLDNYGVLNVESGFYNLSGNFLPMLIHADNSIACNGVHGFLPTQPPIPIDVDGFKGKINEALAVSIPAGIRARAEGAQYFPPLNKTSFDSEARWSCDPTDYDIRYTCPVKTVDNCQTVAELVAGVVHLAATKFGLPEADALGLGTTIVDKEPSNSQRLQRWRCVPRPASRDGQACVDPHKGRCEFIVPIKRINSRPDGVETVFFDRLDDANNAALAIFFASFYDEATDTVEPTSTVFRELCSTERPPVIAPGSDLWNFATRPWATFHGPPAGCGPPPPDPTCAKSCADLTKCFAPPNFLPTGFGGPPPDIDPCLPSVF